MLPRLLTPFVQSDLKRKMVFISGPRQSGKTMLAESLLKKAHPGRWENFYFNWDDNQHRAQIIEYDLPTHAGLIVFDELHKFTRWRGYLKGLYDTQKHKRQILVTGSGRLDYYRRGGDSLQGRYHHLRLYPFSLKEASCSVEDLLEFGPFPEPLTQGSATFAQRWSREYRVRLIRDDLTQLERVTEVGAIEQLMVRLPELVGSPLSINALREDLQVAHYSVIRWMTMLERLFAIFRLMPFGSPKIKAVKKESKHYHFDWTAIKDEGARFENLIAFHLLKYCSFIEDTEGLDCELRFVRDQEGREVDFIVIRDSIPMMVVECKLSDRRAVPALKYFKRKFPAVEAIQVIHSRGVDTRDRDDVRVCSAEIFLKELCI